jgi:aspartate/methionine/tyrosine aminotransferase
MPEPREFFIEDRLESLRTKAEFNLGESGFQPFSLKEIIKTLKIDTKKLEDLSLRDSSHRGSLALREEIAKLYIGIDPDQILITTGTSEGLYIFFRCILEKGDLVSIFWPAFQSLYEIPILIGAKINKVPCLGQKELEIDSLIHPQSKLWILNTPHNPTGLSLKFDPLEFRNKIQSSLDHSNSYLLLDEQYQMISKDWEFQSLSFNHERLISSSSIGKSLGVVGLKTGWMVVCDPKLLQRIRSYKDYLTHTVSPISEYLTLEILKYKNLLLNKIQTTVRDNVQVWNETIANIKDMDCENSIPPEGGMVAFPKLREGIISSKYCNQLYEKTGIFILPGSDFETEGYVRIGFGQSNEIFKKAMIQWMQFHYDSE